MAKTGIHIKRANVGSVEAHNLRTKEYLAGLEKAGRSIYFFQDKTHLNQSWVNSIYEGRSCEQIQADLVELYKEKVGQRPQLQDRIRVNKKTGKEYTVAGWSPIREGVIPIKENTTLSDFWGVIKYAQDKGLNIIRIDLHQDEGYRNETTGETKHNRHAHIVFDWVNHETGKTIKLDKKDMSEFQDIVANSLQMERGTRKEETGLKHIDHIEFREQKAEAHTIELEKKIEEQGETISYQEETIKQQGKEIIELKEEATEAQISTETAILRLNEVKADITTSEQTKAKLEQIKSDLEDALKPTQEKQKRTLAEIQEEHTKRYLWGLVKGATDYEAVSDELWRQQREGENNIVRNEFLQVRKYQEERDRAIRERDEAKKEAQDLREQNNSLKEEVVNALGERFAMFWEDVKRFANNFLMAVGLWRGEQWKNRNETEIYTADKNRCLLLINGRSQDEREEDFRKKVQQVYKRAVETSGESWANFRFRELANKKNYDDRVRELRDIERITEKGKRRGMRR